MKGIRKMIAGSPLLDKRLKDAEHNLRVLTNIERAVVKDRLIIANELAKKLAKMVCDDKLKKFIYLPIVDEKNAVIPGWQFLPAAINTAIYVKTNGHFLGTEPATLNIHLFGNEGFFLKSDETIANLNKAWKGYASLEYLARAGSSMIVRFELVL